MFKGEQLLIDAISPELSLQDLHERYAASTYGRYHAEQPPRFAGRYGYDRADMIYDLGDDVHPVRHMSFTESDIVRPFIVVQNEQGDETFDKEQALIMRATALTHDIGEGKHPKIVAATGRAVGDVAWTPDKDEADETQETAIRSYVFVELYDDVPADLLAAVNDIAAHKQGTFMREAFQAAERLGYYIRGLRAGELVLTNMKTGDEPIDTLRMTQLAKLAVQVTGRHAEFMQEHQDRFPYLALTLSVNTSLQAAINTELTPLKDVAQTA